MSKICANCGKEIPTNAAFCSFCGNPQINEEELSEEEVLRKKLSEAQDTIKAMQKAILNGSVANSVDDEVDAKQTVAQVDETPTIEENSSRPFPVPCVNDQLNVDSHQSNVNGKDNKKTHRGLWILLILLAIVAFVFVISSLSSNDNNKEDPMVNGALQGAFSVSPTKKVCFSMGNLRYQPSLEKWKFADQQYEIVGETNANISSTYSGWIDLFGWGTSGYSHGAYCFEPWNATSDYEHYAAYGKDYKNLNDDSGKADWGYNCIINGGNVEHQWRTLSNEEWDYLLEYRVSASSKHGHASINGISGVVILPDDWKLPQNCTFITGCENGFSTNYYTFSQWELMQAAGAVFLPAPGSRNGVDVGNFGVGGGYWTSSRNDDKTAYSLRFNYSYIRTYTNRTHNGYAVRLVKDVQ